MRHTVKELFPNGFKDYFENSFEGNTMGTLKVQASVLRNSKKNIEDLGTSIAQRILNAIVDIKYTLLSKIKFTWLLPDDLKALQEAVCGAVEHTLLNKDVWERLNSSSISTGSFTLNEDSTSWLLTKDMIGMYAWKMLDSTGIDEYEVVNDGELSFFQETQNGNIQILGKISDDTIKELL